MKLKYYFQTAWLKTLMFNFRVLPWKDALKIPVIIFRNTRINSLKGRIELVPPYRHSMIKIGRCELPGMENAPSVLEVNGVLRLEGKATIGSGSVIFVDRQAELTIGKDFRITGRSTIHCRKKIIFGDDVLVSWDNLFMDNDSHDILDSEGHKLNPPKEISIGSHVWIGCRCTILKGCSIADRCVVASGSLLTRAFTEEGTIIGGGSANRILRSGIEWRR